MAGTTPSAAGPVLDRVRAAQAVSCGAEERPGFAETDAEGDAPAHGLAVDLCRAVAVAVLGPTAKVNFTIIDSAKDVAAVRDGTFDSSSSRAARSRPNVWPTGCCSAPRPSSRQRA